MSQRTLEEIVSSKARLRMANLLSERPRTLRELADLTGVSVQAVLKHLNKLKSLGLVSEERITGGTLPVRRLYSMKGVHVGDFSLGDLMVVKMSTVTTTQSASSNPSEELESLAADSIVQRRRVRDQARRLARLIDDLVGTELRIGELVSGLDLKDEDRLILHTAYTEESLEDAEKALNQHYGMKNSRRALERAIAEARKHGKK